MRFLPKFITRSSHSLSPSSTESISSMSTDFVYFSSLQVGRRVKWSAVVENAVDRMVEGDAYPILLGEPYACEDTYR